MKRLWINFILSYLTTTVTVKVRMTMTKMMIITMWRHDDLIISLLWLHDERESVSNHQPHSCLLIRLWRRSSKKHQSSASLAFVRGIHRWPVNSPHKGPVTREMFPFDDVIMYWRSPHIPLSSCLFPVHFADKTLDSMDLSRAMHVIVNRPNASKTNGIENHVLMTMVRRTQK